MKIDSFVLRGLLATTMLLVAGSVQAQTLSMPLSADTTTLASDASADSVTATAFDKVASTATSDSGASEVCTKRFGDGDCSGNSWTGFYLGANGGYGWTDFNPVISPFGATAISDFRTVAMDHTARGALFGGHAGYNRQVENWVFGGEGDFDGAGIGGSQERTFPSLLNPTGALNGAETTDRIDWLASIRGRLGYTRGPGLLYFTGGVAWEGITQDAFVNAETAPAVFGVSTVNRVSNTRTGYVFGCGYERMIAEHWTLRGEYLFYEFDQTNTVSLPFRLSTVPGSAAIINTGANSINAFRLGVSYKF